MAKKRASKAAVAPPANVEVIEQNRDFPDAGGRPEFEPTLANRNGVRLMRADGWTVDRIARRIGVSANTLRKHFAEELSDGADIVRLKVLADLDRASSKGKVAASNALLKLSGLEPPPPPPKADAPAEKPTAPEEKLGKKEAAKIAAQTAEQGTTWHELMTDDGPPN